LAHAEGCAYPRHEQEREGQFCYSSQKHAIDLDLDFEPMALGINGFWIKISACWL
jgi:hypothetical protein